MVNFADMALLKILTDNMSRPKLLIKLLRKAKKYNLEILFELSKNILENNVPISEIQKRKLHKYENKLVFLATKKKNLKDKVDILLKSKFLLHLLLVIGKEFLIDQFYSEPNSEYSESEISELSSDVD
jgi:flagella basal body P-ring formation protein FlgA